MLWPHPYQLIAMPHMQTRETTLNNKAKKKQHQLRGFSIFFGWRGSAWFCCWARCGCVFIAFFCCKEGYATTKSNSANLQQQCWTTLLKEGRWVSTKLGSLSIAYNWNRKNISLHIVAGCPLFRDWSEWKDSRASQTVHHIVGVRCWVVFLKRGPLYTVIF